MADNKGAELKAFFIFLTEDGKALEPHLAKLAEKTGANDVALAHLAKSDRAVSRYKVSLEPEVKNTIIVYRKKRVTDKFVNLKADEKGLAELKAAIAKATAAQ